MSKSSRDYIELHDSDSEPEVPQIKRQKTEHHPSKYHVSWQLRVVDSLYSYFLEANTAKMSYQTSPAADLAGRNANLKGRRRFNADFDDLKKACTQGFVAHGLVLSRVRAGDDEGSLEALIKTSSGAHVLNVNLMLPETADYPKSHSYFSYSQDSDVPENINAVVQKIPELPTRPIAETMDKVLANLARALSTGSADSESDNEDDDEEDDFVVLSDDDDMYASRKLHQGMNMSRIQHDFLQLAASPYRPGLIRLSGDDFCISVSLSVVKLAESIPARALMAWDRRLLSRTQNLVLLINKFNGVYPPSGDSTKKLEFRVGVCGRYKPSQEHAREVCRNFGLITNDAEDELKLAQEKAAAEAAMNFDWDMDEDDANYNANTSASKMQVEEEEEEIDVERFDKFSLSGSLDSLMNHAFSKLVDLRRKYGLGWAGAELLYSEIEKSQKPSEEVLSAKLKEIQLEDKAERAMVQKGNTVLPDDPLFGLASTDEVNWPLTAFSYLTRRLTLCTRYCIVCHNKLNTDYVALKPYVCESKLCAYQYYSLNHGPSLEYEIIHNPETVDLLVSITYLAAMEGVLDEPLPIGMGLRVPVPDTSKILAPPPNHGFRFGAAAISVGTTVGTATPTASTPVVVDGLCDFDALDKQQMRASVVQLLDSLPCVSDMKKHLEQKVKPGKSKPKLITMPPPVDSKDSEVPAAAWKLLRWCVGSCTAYLEEISSQEESVKNVDSSWKQYRFSVGAPDAEAKFKKAVEEAKSKSSNAAKYPSLYAFHGSPVRNWHSIIRNGLWFREIANGRAFGDGVYLAKDSATSMGHYASGNRGSGWRRSKICPSSCVAIVEVVNLPSEFATGLSVAFFSVVICLSKLWPKAKKMRVRPRRRNYRQPRHLFVKLDPVHPITLGGHPIQIPEPGFQLQNIVRARQEEDVDEDFDDEDQAIFTTTYESSQATDKGKGKENDPMEIDEDDDDMSFEITDVKLAPRYEASSSAPAARQQKPKARPADDWVHDPEYVRKAVSQLMPAPEIATPGATMAVQKELKALLKEQNTCSSFRELGWYMAEEFMGDNLFQCHISGGSSELHSFDPKIPIAQDMKAKNLNSLIFEIRFPPDYPLSPPFFRIITPRFLPFIHGGGGHVTGGGSICMDLLTSSGWLPSYSIASVLLCIKLAISNLEPRPARLAPNWSMPYSVHEALEGYKRAANTHNWQIPKGLDKLVR
ncbi:hypothetical protein BT96DRAFT_1014269 [Gymnopus androsaceus JB14]|uniref:UBC core domain-containing protein n=1 Tax=Gymnopus androsaceus JB14 TaxID=1447944 RepID=A0A6A4IDD2_9AGAR|nr:hypothetical protein BT96DRAFT_1014269 [Gymnopus androsaceus JB14]